MLFLLLLASGSVAAEVSATDSDGRRLVLARPAERIVSLAPHITELLFAAGAGAKIVAVSQFSDYPEPAKKLPQVASSSAIDLERVIALKADLVVAWRLGATAQSLDRLASLGIPVFYSEPHKLADIPAQLAALGTLAGTESIARPAAGELRATIARLRDEYSGRTPLTVFYQISDRPLMTVNGHQFISDALAVCGARNVFADAPTIAPVVNAEAVVAADPDVIVGARGDTLDSGWEAAWKRFPGLRAVRDGNFITVRASVMHRHGPRAIAATRELCQRLEEARGLASRLKAASRR